MASRRAKLPTILAWALPLCAVASLAAVAESAPASNLHPLYDGIIVAALIAIALLGWRNRSHRNALLLRDRRLKRLLKLSWELEQARDYGAILTAASAAISDEIGFASSWLFLAKADDPDLVYLIADKASGSVDIRGNHPTLRFAGDKMMEEIRDSRHAVVVEDAWTDPRTDKEKVAKNNNRTIVNVPLVTSDRRLGCLGTGTFGDEGTRRLAPDEIAYLEEVSKRLCPSLDRLEQYADRLRAEAESRRLAAAIDQTVEGVALTDPDGTVRYCNSSFSLLLDMSRDRLVGALLPLVEPKGVVADTVTAGRRWRGRVAHRRNDGQVVELDLSLTPTLDDAGQVAAVVAVVADASDETRLERARSFFAAVTSHELRTPLTKLTMVLPYLHDALRGRAEEKVVGAAVEEAVEGIAQVVTATGILSALERGEGAEVGPGQRFNLKESLAAQVAKAHEKSGKAGRNISIDFEWKPALATVELSAPTLLTAAVEELLSNAVKYSPDGTRPALTVREGEVGIVIEVTDRGPGMAENEIRQAMAPFFSLERPELHSTGRYRYQGGGIGLGLTIAKMVAEYMRGRIEITPRGERAGLTVRMVLPTVRMASLVTASGPKE